MHPPLFLGIDAGGTRTRALLADASGAIIGVGESGPANVSGPKREAALEHMSEAAASARGSIDAQAIGAVCAGAAGVLSMPSAAEHFGARLRSALGVGGPVAFLGDAVTAFAAGTAESEGVVLIAGTGAVALKVRGHTGMAGRADGYGWLLGDAGSGFWLGREAVSAALRHLDGHGPGGRMVGAVLGEIAPAEHTSGQIVAQCMLEAPARLARFAPMVCEAAESGDELARNITGRAVAHLMASAEAVIEQGRPLVLAGSLLTEPTPVARGLRERLAERLPDTPVLTAAEPVRGAAWLAGRGFAPDEAARRELHRRITTA